MNDVALQKQIDELSKEMRLAGDATQTNLEDLRTRVDRLRIEMVALRKALDAALPSFSDTFEASLEKATREVDPERE